MQGEYFFYAILNYFIIRIALFFKSIYPLHSKICETLKAKYQVANQRNVCKTIAIYIYISDMWLKTNSWEKDNLASQSDRHESRAINVNASYSHYICPLTSAARKRYARLGSARDSCSISERQKYSASFPLYVLLFPRRGARERHVSIRVRASPVTRMTRARLSPLFPPHHATTDRASGRAAAAILSVRCQYFPNVTGFLGVDRAISCLAARREVIVPSARWTVVDVVRYTCHGDRRVRASRIRYVKCVARFVVCSVRSSLDRRLGVSFALVVVVVVVVVGVFRRVAAIHRSQRGIAVAAGDLRRDEKAPDCHRAAGIRERADRRSLLWPITVDFIKLLTAFNYDFLPRDVCTL